MIRGDLLFIVNDDWDIWFHADEIGRVFESDFVPELQPALILGLIYEPRWEGAGLFEVYVVLTAARRFWISKKVRYENIPRS